MTTMLSHVPVARARSGDAAPRGGIPPLHNGDRLSQPEFHRRYEAMPADFRAELIGGIVYVASPLRLPHGKFHYRLTAALSAFEASTPGVEGADNATVILGSESEPQPDLHMRLLPDYGGRSRVNEAEYLVGPPELVIEVAHSSAALDLHAKREDYERAGVLEYLVLLVEGGALRAFDLAAGTERAVGVDGIYRSRVFPGLWIDVGAVLTGNMSRVAKAARRGASSPEHAAFVRKLKAVASRKSPRVSSPKRRRKPNA